MQNPSPKRYSPVGAGLPAIVWRAVMPVDLTARIASRLAPTKTNAAQAAGFSPCGSWPAGDCSPAVMPLTGTNRQQAGSYKDK
jgi:hypothetical protein